MSAIYVFDAYGTLFDVHSAVARHRDVVGPQADRLSELWRTKQLEYTWVRSLMGAYADFRSRTAEALDYAAARTGVTLASATREALLAAYETLSAFPEVKDTLVALKSRGATTAILSNGTPAMLANAVTSAGIGELLDAVLSVDPLRIYKTDARTYQLVIDRFGCSPGDVWFQSSNRWDVAGAAKFGFRTSWINRAGLPDEYADLPPTRVLLSLDGLLGD
jgi:2-haloacid dehalogenase